MKIEQVHIVCFSPTKTTRHVLDAIASAFTVKVKIHDATLSLESIQLPEFLENDLVLVGAPVYGGRVPREAEDFYKSIRGKGSPVAVVAVYGNCILGDALVEMSEYCPAGGCRVIAGAAFIGEHSFTNAIASGRPNRDDLRLAKEFGSRLEAKVLADDFTSVELPGNLPLKTRNPVAPSPFAPSTTEDCIECGLCVINCPVQIIDPNNPRLVLMPEKCLRCGSCVKICPVSAKFFAGEAFERSIKYLSSSCSEDKTPIIFI